MKRIASGEREKMGNASGKDEIEDEDGSNDASIRSGSGADPSSGRVRRIRSVDSAGSWPLGSPDHSLSPLLPIPKIPAATLQGIVCPPIFNRPLINESTLPLAGSLSKGIPTLITWNHGGDTIFVEGSWDHWISRKPLQRSGKDHDIMLVLPSGVYEYKFIVDGELRYLPELPSVSDEEGHTTNLLDVHDYVPENPESISEFDLPPSPDSSYTWSSADDDFAKEPPFVPPDLHLTVLGMRDSDETSHKPRHVVLNHLFIEKEPSSPVVALGMTHRFKSKYATVVLYKPTRR